MNKPKQLVIHYMWVLMRLELIPSDMIGWNDIDLFLYSMEVEVRDER